MKIIIETVPHASQRYPTCGDWYVDPDMTVHIKVSQEIGMTSAGLVAIHELSEFFLCTNGFAMNSASVDALVQRVDEFDKNYKGDLVDEEPGDDPKAPYNRQHSIATAIERILCADLGLSWKAHDDAVAALFDEH